LVDLLPRPTSTSL